MSPILLVSIGHFLCLIGMGTSAHGGGRVGKHGWGGRVGEGVLIRVVLITKHLVNYCCLSYMLNVDHVDVESCVLSK